MFLCPCPPHYPLHTPRLALQREGGKQGGRERWMDGRMDWCLWSHVPSFWRGGEVLLKEQWHKNSEDLVLALPESPRVILLFFFPHISVLSFPVGEMRKFDDLICKDPLHSKFLFILYLIKGDKTSSWVETVFSVRSTSSYWLPNVRPATVCWCAVL